MAKVYMTRYLLMPFHATPLILVAIFTIVWAYAIKGGVFGIPADIILASWFSKYCYVLLDSVVAGHKELPVLSVEMLNPVDEQRPLVQAIIVSLGFIASWWLYHSVGPVAGLMLGALLVMALPATVALLAIGDSWLHALSPVAIVRLVKGMGLTYFGVLVVTLGGMLLVVTLALTLDSLLLTLVLAQLLFIAMFCYVGGAVFESRIDLQLATRTFDERLAELKGQVDQDRLEQEVALLLQRLDVDEEVDRLGAHVEEIRRIIAGSEPAGRRLDFLMQELNREANTLSSKSQDLETTRAAVDMKVLIEQLREQVQNIE